MLGRSWGGVHAILYHAARALAGSVDKRTEPVNRRVLPDDALLNLDCDLFEPLIVATVHVENPSAKPKDPALAGTGSYRTMERATGVEPASSAWKAEVLPMNYARVWSGRQDLNLRHPAPKAGALPNCATSRRP